MLATCQISECKSNDDTPNSSFFNMCTCDCCRIVHCYIQMASHPSQGETERTVRYPSTQVPSHPTQVDPDSDTHIQMTSHPA